MDRRSFLLSSCQACAALAVLPALATLESCSSTKAITGMVEENGKVTLPTAELGEQGHTIIHPKSASDPVMVAKHADGTYGAYLLKCPHKGGPLSEKNGVLECDWHHSTFDFSGKVQKGPAKSDLTHYPVTEERGNLVIQLL